MTRLRLALPVLVLVLAAWPAPTWASHGPRSAQPRHRAFRVSLGSRIRVGPPATGRARGADPAVSSPPAAGGPAVNGGRSAGEGEPAPTGPEIVLFEDRFDLGDGLITNEYATWNPTSAQASPSPAWTVTSGSLFARKGAGWTGVPDGCATSSVRSTPCTASDVFRLDTKERDFDDVTVSMELVNEGLTSSKRTPKVSWDGVHIWLRHQSELSLYYASVNRRDGHVVLKKKCPGGTENGGTYYALADAAGHPIPLGSTQRVAARVHDEADGSVGLELYREGVKLLSAIDRGVGCAPIAAAGSVGVRGDNDEFSIDDFKVTAG